MANNRPNPYPGPRSFQQGEQLHGRERETAELLDLLIAERIVLLYSPSGAGKTSLIQAALIPELAREGFRVLPIMRPGLIPAAPGANAANRYILSLLLTLEKDLPAAQQTRISELAAAALPDYLDRLPAPETAGWHGDVLIFDQFEEILTVDPADQEGKAAFFEQVGKVLRDRNRWALFSMREEFIAGLDPYLRAIPTRFDKGHRYRLDLLSRDAARQAMQQPARAGGVAFTDAAAAKLADDLRAIRVQLPDGSTSVVPGHTVEPVQLQVVCRRLWDRLRPDDEEIDVADVQDVGDVDSALRGYYADSVADVAAKTGLHERTVREWTETQLITEQGIRGQVLQGPAESPAGRDGLANRGIWPLVDAHLVRAEQRRGATWFELAHDRLIEPVRKDNAEWRDKNLAPLQRQAALWDGEERPKGLLLQGIALQAAEVWAADHASELEEQERDFLDACREARSAAARERRQARSIRWLAIGATVFAVVAALLALNTFQQLLTVQQAYRQADNAAIAEAAAKSEAEARRFAAETAQAQAEAAAVEARQAEATAQAERDRARQQSDIARSRQVAAVASDALTRDNGALALLLGVSAHEITDTVEADKVLHEALAGWRGRGVLAPHAGRVFSAEFSPDGRKVATSAEETVHLWEVEGQRRTLALRGHTAPVTDMEWSPNGRYVATVSRDGTGRLWDAETGREVWQAPTPNEGISVTFHPDGRTIAFGGDDGRITLWQIAPLAKLATLAHGSWGFPLHMGYSPDGQLLAAAYNDGLARVWRGGQATELRGHDGVVRDIAFSPDGRTIGTVGDDNTIRLWDSETGRALGSAGARELENRLWFSPDGRYVAAPSRSGVAYLWDTTKFAEPPFVLAGHTEPVEAIAFSPDGRSLATASFDRTARLWDLETKTTKAVLAGHDDRLWWTAFSPDGRYLVTASADGTARLWDPNLAMSGEVIARRYGAPLRLAGLTDNSQGIVSVQDGLAHVWQPATGAERSFKIDATDIRAAALSPDGTRLAVADGTGTTSLWDVARGRQTAVIPAREGVRIHSLAFDPTGQHLALARQDGSITIWNTTKRQDETTLTGHRGDVYSVAFSPDGTRLASTGADGVVRVWDWRKGDAERTWGAGKSPGKAVAFAPDGDHLAAANHAGEIRVWDLTSGGDDPVAAATQASTIRVLAFSPDSDGLAAGDEQGAATLWRWRTAEPIPLGSHRRWVTGLAFTPDGQQLVSTGQDGMVRVWPASADATIDLACARAASGTTDEEWRRNVPKSLGEPPCFSVQGQSWTPSNRLAQPRAPIPAGSLLPESGPPTIFYFEALPGAQVAEGDPVLLRWDLANAKEVYLYTGEEETGVAAPEEVSVVPTAPSTTYRLVARNDQGETERTLTVTPVKPR